MSRIEMYRKRYEAQLIVACFISVMNNYELDKVW